MGTNGTTPGVPGHQGENFFKKVHTRFATRSRVRVTAYPPELLIFMGTPSSGRLVWNHSTHLPGLIPILEKLTEFAGIRTVTPAVIGTTRSNTPRLTIKVSTPIRGGFKLIARKGKSFQEVFVVTELSKEDLEGAIAQLLS